MRCGSWHSWLPQWGTWVGLPDKAWMFCVISDRGNDIHPLGILPKWPSDSTYNILYRHIAFCIFIVSKRLFTENIFENLRLKYKEIAGKKWLGFAVWRDSPSFVYNLYSCIDKVVDDPLKCRKLIIHFRM